MSLKSFHVFFVLMALALLAFLAYWSERHMGEGPFLRPLAALSFSGLAVGLPYLGWFLRKARSIR